MDCSLSTVSICFRQKAESLDMSPHAGYTVTGRRYRTASGTSGGHTAGNFVVKSALVFERLKLAFFFPFPSEKCTVYISIFILESKNRNKFREVFSSSRLFKVFFPTVRKHLQLKASFILLAEGRDVIYVILVQVTGRPD